MSSHPTPSEHIWLRDTAPDFGSYNLLTYNHWPTIIPESSAQHQQHGTTFWLALQLLSEGLGSAQDT